MKRLMFALALAAMTVACEQSPGQRISNTNPKVTTEVIVDFDGVRLYRVTIDNSYIYVAAQEHTLTTSRFIQDDGTGSYTERITTVAKR